MNIDSCLEILYRYVFRIWFIMIINEVIIVICMIICILLGMWLWIREMKKLDNVVINIIVSVIINVVFSLVVIVSVEYIFRICSVIGLLFKIGVNIFFFSFFVLDIS